MDVKKNQPNISDFEIKSIQKLLNSKHPKIQQGVAMLICSLAEEDERYRERGGPGVIKPLIEMLQKETSLKIVAAEALCNISNNNEHNCNLIIREGGIKHLISCLRIKKAVLREWVTSTLCNIAFCNEANCLAIESEGGIKGLVELLKDASERIVYAACSTLRNMAANSRHCSNVIVESGGLSLLFELIKSDLEEDEDLITVAVSTLCNLTFKNEVNCKKVVETEGNIKILLDSLKLRNVETQIAILNTLLNLAQCEFSCRYLLDNNILSFLTELETSKVPEIRETVLKTIALCNLVRDKFQRRGSTQKGLKRMTRFHIDPLNLEKANKPSGEKPSKVKEVAAILIKKLTPGGTNEKEKEGNGNLNSPNLIPSTKTSQSLGVSISNSPKIQQTSQISPRTISDDSDTSTEDDKTKLKEDKKPSLAVVTHTPTNKKRDKTKR